MTSLLGSWNHCMQQYCRQKYVQFFFYVLLKRKRSREICIFFLSSKIKIRFVFSLVKGQSKRLLHVIVRHCISEESETIAQV